MTLLVGTNSTTGYTNTTGFNGAYNWYLPFVASATGTGTSIWVYAANYDGAAAFRLAIWDSTGTVLVVSAELLNGTAGWQQATISNTTITSGNTYYLGIVPNGAYIGLLTNTATAPQYHINATYPSAATIVPGTDSYRGTSDNFSIYVDGTTGGIEYTVNVTDGMIISDNGPGASTIFEHVLNITDYVIFMATPSQKETLYNIVDAIFNTDNVYRDSSLTVADELLLYDALIREIGLLSISDYVAFIETITMMRELYLIDNTLNVDTLMQVREILLYDRTLLDETQLQQRIVADTRALIFARLAAADPLGMQIMTADPLGMQIGWEN